MHQKGETVVQEGRRERREASKEMCSKIKNGKAGRANSEIMHL